jgi:pimeloyl-ACP methyl ester carboxylesterase
LDRDRLPLLLLPGLLCDETAWRHQVDALGDLADVRVVTYPDATTVAAMAERVLAVAPPSFALAGHSMGGRVAFEVWRAAPERVVGLAVMDTAAGPAGPAEEPARRQLVRIARERGMDALLGEWLPPMVHPDRLTDTTVMEPLSAMVRRHSPEQFAGQIEALLSRPDAHALLAGISVPTLVLCGREDSWRSVDEHRDLAARIPGARFVEVPRCGHMAPFERPEVVNACLRQWLEPMLGP